MCCDYFGGTMKCFKMFFKEKKERKKNLFAQKINYKLLTNYVSLNECNDIRKMLNKKYLGKVPSKAA